MIYIEKVIRCFKKQIPNSDFKLRGAIKISLTLYFTMQASQKSSGEISSSLIPQGAFNIDEFMNAPLAIQIQSSSEQIQAQISSPDNQGDRGEEIQYVLVQRERYNEAKRLKKLQQIAKKMKQAEERERSQLQEIKRNPPKRSNSTTEVMRQKQLRKQFPSKKFLPVKSLERVKQKLKNIALNSVCQFQKDTDCNDQQIKIRQQQRLNLTRALLFAHQQISLLKKEQKSDLEIYLCKQDEKILMYAYDVSKKYEEIFFSKLYKLTEKKSNKIGDVYIKQFKLVLKQLDDKNNIELRRKIFRRKFCPNALSYAKQQELQCEKTKKENEQKLRQLIRENQKIVLEKEEVIEIFDGPFQLPNNSHIKSSTQIYEIKQETEQQAFIRRRLQMIKKTKGIFKKSHSIISNALNEMKQRMKKIEQVMEQQKRFD